MAAKTVTISARIPHEDAEFISQLSIDGAATPSDKLRAIIEGARRHQHGRRDYRGCMDLITDLVNPVSSYVREQEHNQQIHSEIVTRMLDWLPDTMAFIMESANVVDDKKDKNKLTKLEDGIADRVFRLMESVLQMGVTQRCPCYNDKAIHERIEPILDLVQVIGMTQKQQEEK